MILIIIGVVLMVWGIRGIIIEGRKEEKEFQEMVRQNREEAKKIAEEREQRRQLFAKIKLRREHKVCVSKSKNWRM